MTRQRIDGDNNVQVGKLEGDVIVDRLAPIMREDDPDIVYCPFDCGQRTWWNAPECWNCGRPVLEYFNNQARAARKATLIKRAAILGTLGVAMLWGSSYLPNGISGMAMAVGIIAMIVAFASIQVADKL